MFKKDHLETPPDKVNMLIGKDTYFKGSIRGKGLIRIDGETEGNVSNNGDVVIGESGYLKADLKGRNITIAGRYEGALEADGRLELKKTAVVSGTFKVKTLSVEDGAVVNGTVDSKHKEQVFKTSGKKDSDDEPFGTKA